MAALLTFFIKMGKESEDGQTVDNKELEQASSLNFLRSSSLLLRVSAAIRL